MTAAVAHDDAAGILFSNKQLSLEDVADAAAKLIARPQLLKTIPAYRAAMIHLLRPFPALGLPLLERFAAAGRKRQRKGTV